MFYIFARIGRSFAARFTFRRGIRLAAVLDAFRLVRVRQIVPFTRLFVALFRSVVEVQYEEQRYASVQHTYIDKRQDELFY